LERIGRSFSGGIPEHVDDDSAAAFPAGTGYLTGYLVLTQFVDFKPGQSIFAPGIGGAVRMESVQIALKLGASLAISTANTTAKAEQARAAGTRMEKSSAPPSIIARWAAS